MRVQTTRLYRLQANSAWYVTLIMCQFWHIWFCKTRRMSVFQHSGMLGNRVTIYGVLIAVGIMLLCTYVPWLQDHVFYNADPVAVAAWVPHFFFLAFILVYSESTKWYARNNPDAWVVRKLIW
jgi:sodium/potassium-transporting ATPase subunit alpha